MYIHERPDWPQLHGNNEDAVRPAGGCPSPAGLHLSRSTGGAWVRFAGEEAVLRTLTEDVVKSSEIEGQAWTPKRFGRRSRAAWEMDAGGLRPAADRDVEGVVEMMLDATQTTTSP